MNKWSQWLKVKVSTGTTLYDSGYSLFYFVGGGTIFTNFEKDLVYKATKVIALIDINSFIYELGVMITCSTLKKKMLLI